MTFSLAKFLLNSTKLMNGHLQHEVSGLSISDGLELCRDLEELTHNQFSFVLQLWTDETFTLYQVDYWKKGEHQDGHTDRLILSVEK